MTGRSTKALEFCIDSDDNGELKWVEVEDWCHDNGIY